MSMAKTKTVSFCSIKIGGFFRKPGRGVKLWQRVNRQFGCNGQCITGKGVGDYENSEGPVIPVEAKLMITAVGKETVSLRKLSVGSFFMLPGRGRGVWQKVFKPRRTYGQRVNGKDVGDFGNMSGQVIPVEAKLVIKKAKAR